MMLGTKSTTMKNLFIISFSLLYIFALPVASATNSTVSSSEPETLASQVATVHAHFNAPMVTPIAQNQQIRRAKKLGKKGGYNKLTKKSNCIKTTTPLNNGGEKVTKKCVHQYVFGNHNDVKTAYGSGRTKAPTFYPSSIPSSKPSSYPTSIPTSAPTVGPTSGPTTSPTSSPTTSPTASPTAGPTAGPTQTELLISSLPSEARGFKTSSSKAAIGALVGGALGFVLLAAGAKAVESAWKRQASSEDDDDESTLTLREDMEQASG